MLVKICGITTLEDAMTASRLGADMLGFNFYPPSKRYLEPGACREIVDRLREDGIGVLAVGVFVNAGQDEITGCMQTACLDYAQLSGDEEPAFCRSLHAPWIKGLRPQNKEDALQAGQAFSALPYPTSSPPNFPRLLIDAYVPNEYGGTGKTGNWQTAASLARSHPILLAGGLKPENIQAAVRQVRPAGVDVASGVEYRPGFKDPQKMADFIRLAKNT